MYLTFAEYQAYGGTLDEAAYTRYEFMARRAVDSATFLRLKNSASFSEAVKRLMFELINLYSSADFTSGSYQGQVTSEGNDGYSLTMAADSVITPEKSAAMQKELIERYLDGETDTSGTPLLYCGLV